LEKGENVFPTWAGFNGEWLPAVLFYGLAILMLRDWVELPPLGDEFVKLKFFTNNGGL